MTNNTQHGEIIIALVKTEIGRIWNCMSQFYNFCLMIPNKKEYYPTKYLFRLIFIPPDNWEQHRYRCYQYIQRMSQFKKRKIHQQ